MPTDWADQDTRTLDTLDPTDLDGFHKAEKLPWSSLPLLGRCCSWGSALGVQAKVGAQDCGDDVAERCRVLHLSQDPCRLCSVLTFWKPSWSQVILGIHKSTCLTVDCLAPLLLVEDGDSVQLIYLMIQAREALTFKVTKAKGNLTKGTVRRALAEEEDQFGDAQARVAEGAVRRVKRRYSRFLRFNADHPNDDGTARWNAVATSDMCGTVWPTAGQHLEKHFGANFDGPAILVGAKVTPTPAKYDSRLHQLVAPGGGPQQQADGGEDPLGNKLF